MEKLRYSCNADRVKNQQKNMRNMMETKKYDTNCYLETFMKQVN